MRMANRFEMPIISFVDTPGAFPGIEAEERHVAEAIAVNLREMATFNVPIIVVVIGEEIGGALGVAVADHVMILENAYYSVISPRVVLQFLKDRAFAPDASAALKLDAHELLKLGVADQIIEEPTCGAHAEWNESAERVKNSIVEVVHSLSHLAGLNLQTIRKISTNWCCCRKLVYKYVTEALIRFGLLRPKCHHAFYS